MSKLRCAASALDLDLRDVHGAESEADAAFHLGADHVGIDGDAAVDRADDALDLDLAVGHRHVGDLRDERAEGLVHRNAPGAAGARRSSPAGHVGRELEDAGGGLVLVEQREAERDRILACRSGELIHHRFHDEGGVRVADRAPWPGP